MLTAVRMVVLAVCVAVALALSSGPAAAQETVTIPVGDNWFCDSSFQNGVCETTVNVGDTVAWDFSGAGQPHTSTECGADCDSPIPEEEALWHSGIISDGSTFSFEFTQAGTYLYYCQVHPLEMRGQIVVQGDGQVQPTDTPPPAEGGEEATPTAEVVAVPDTGTGAAGGSGPLWVVTLLAAAGAALIGVGALAYRRVRA